MVLLNSNQFLIVEMFFFLFLSLQNENIKGAFKPLSNFDKLDSNGKTLCSLILQPFLK